MTDPRYTPAELRELAQGGGPHYVDNVRTALHWCANVIEAADVLIAEFRAPQAPQPESRAQDDALILQMLEALEGAERDNHIEGISAYRAPIITAARARLEKGKT